MDGSQAGTYKFVILEVTFPTAASMADLGFIEDRGRAVVALTRAKHHLWVFGGPLESDKSHVKPLMLAARRWLNEKNAVVGVQDVVIQEKEGPRYLRVEESTWHADSEDTTLVHDDAEFDVSGFISTPAETAAEQEERADAGRGKDKVYIKQQNGNNERSGDDKQKTVNDAGFGTMIGRMITASVPGKRTERKSERILWEEAGRI